MQQRAHKKWRLCPACSLMVYSSHGLGNHQCPQQVQDKMEEDLDAVVGAEMETFDQDLRRFWRHPQTKFYDYLVQNKRY